MRTENRLFGKNMRVFMHEAGISEQDLSQKFGYTEYELNKIMAARSYVSMEEEQNIADFFKKPLEEFFETFPSARYEAAGCYECRGEFQKPENQELIFDIFDMYCDVQEALSESD